MLGKGKTATAQGGRADRRRGHTGSRSGSGPEKQLVKPMGDPRELPARAATLACDRHMRPWQVSGCISQLRSPLRGGGLRKFKARFTRGWRHMGAMDAAHVPRWSFSPCMNNVGHDTFPISARFGNLSSKNCAIGSPTKLFAASRTEVKAATRMRPPMGNRLARNTSTSGTGVHAKRAGLHRRKHRRMDKRGSQTQTTHHHHQTVFVRHAKPRDPDAPRQRALLPNIRKARCERRDPLELLGEPTLVGKSATSCMCVARYAPTHIGASGCQTQTHARLRDAHWLALPAKRSITTRTSAPGFCLATPSASRKSSHS